jgi:serine/threonine-protein kinase
MEPLVRGRTLASLALAQTLDETPPGGLAAEPWLAGGAVVLRRFVVQRRLGFGAGGIGSVYEAFDKERRAAVALHLIPADLGSGRALALHAGERVLGVSHPHVVRVHEVLPGPDGTVVVVRELVRGATVRRVLDRARRAGTVIHWPDAARIALAVLDGLEHIHRSGRHHSCLCPETVLVDAQGGVRLTGLVIGYLVPAAELSARALLLDPAYVAPESRAGRAGPDPAAWRLVDIYAAGALLCELLTGAAPPRQGVPHAEAGRDDAPRGLDAILRRALAEDPAARFATAEMALALRSLAPARSSSERRAAITPEADRSRPLLRLAAMLLAVAAVFAVAALLAGREPAGPTPAVAEAHR